MGRLKKLTRMRETGVLIPLLLLWIVTFAVNNSFLLAHEHDGVVPHGLHHAVGHRWAKRSFLPAA